MSLREQMKNVWARRPRLHRSSVVVGLLVAGVFVLLVIPGEPIEYLYVTTGPPPGYRYYVRHSHGWPWQWYEQQSRHDVGIETSPDAMVDGGIPWLRRDGWRIPLIDGRPLERVQFEAMAALKDLVIIGSVVVLIVSVWEARRRRRRSAWQVTLRESIAMIAVFAFVFAYCAHLQRTHENDVRYSGILRQLGCHTNLDTTPRWKTEPTWLRRLVGADRVPEWLSHITEVNLMAISTEKVENVLPHLQSLAYLEKIVIEDAHERPLPVAHFSGLSSLRELQIHEYEPLDAETIEQLKTLKQLDTLSIMYASSLSDAARQELEQSLPNCEIVAHSAQ